MTDEVKKDDAVKDQQPDEKALWEQVQKDRKETAAGDVAPVERVDGADVKTDPADPYAGLPEPTRKLIEGLQAKTTEIEGRFSKVNQQLATAHGTIGNLKQRLDASHVELTRIAPVVETVENEKKAKEQAAKDAKAAKVKDLRERLGDLPDVAELMDLVLPADAEPAKEVKAESKAEPKNEPEKTADLPASREAQLVAERELSDLHPGWKKITTSDEYKKWRAAQPADIRETNPSEDLASAVADADKLISAFKKHKEDAASVAKVEKDRQERLRRGEGVHGRGSSTGEVDTSADALWNKVKRDREKARQSG